MVLGFKVKFPWGEPTNFKEKILARTKIHTIRKRGRWRAGLQLHMANGVRTIFYNQFNAGRRDLSTCTGTQDLEIIYKGPRIRVFIDRKEITYMELLQLAHNDGFDSTADFKRWFNTTQTDLQIIHWTGFRY